MVVTLSQHEPQHIAHMVSVLKCKYLNWYLLRCGDFNSGDISSIRDRELVNAVHKPTCGNNAQDMIISNLRLFYQKRPSCHQQADMITPQFSEALCAIRSPASEAVTLLASHHRLGHLILWALCCATESQSSMPQQGR